MISDITIRSAQISDIEAIMQIERSAFELHICETRDVFIERLTVFSPGFLVAATSTGQITGYICSELWSYSDQPELSNLSLNHKIQKTHMDNGSELYISSLAVLPEFRGHNLGKLLFTELLDRAAKQFALQSSILLVNTQWQQASEMYARQGFVQVAVLQDFFTNEQPDKFNRYQSDGIVMRKKSFKQL